MSQDMRDERESTGHEVAATATDMRMVMAVIQPFRLDAVMMALEQLPGFGGMTVTDCRGFGRSGPPHDVADGGERGSSVSRPALGDRGVTDFSTKVRLEAIVNGADLAREVLDTIVRVAHTGRAGDGKVFSWPVMHVVRVRTSETDANAL